MQLAMNIDIEIVKFGLQDIAIIGGLEMAALALRIVVQHELHPLIAHIERGVLIVGSSAL